MSTNLRTVIYQGSTGEKNGKFHKWSYDTVSNEDFALIEDDDGIMIYVCFDRVRFVDTPQGCQKSDVIHIPESGIGDVSDGYHTFNELYHHRAVLFSVICNMFPEIAWKSKLHNDGTMFKDMFIVGFLTPEGQVTYHYDIEIYWDMFGVPELEKAPEWDGHTPEQAIERMKNVSKLISLTLGNGQVKKKGFLQKLFCKHQYEGIEYHHIEGGNRKVSTYICAECGKIKMDLRY